MYKIAPILDDNVEINLPTCMYTLKLQQGPTTNKVLEANDELSELVCKQNSIFERILKLQEQVEKLKSDFNVSTDTNNLSIHTIKTTPSSTPTLKIKVEKGISNDIVINANPKSFPLAVWILHHMFSKSLKIYLTSYTHSSVVETPPYLNYFKSTQNIPRSQCDLKLTIIWKNVADQEMIVNPIKSSPITGEPNIARYLARITNSLYENLGSEDATEIDRLLDLVNFSKASNKEQQSVLRLLNSHLGRKSFLVGDNVTLADIVLWSQLVETKLQKSLPKNLSAWFKRLYELDAFSSVPGSFFEGA